MAVTALECQRNQRQLMLTERGEAGRYWQAASGAGGIGILDYGAVELSNLPRQIFHGDTDPECPVGRRAAC
jgi:hypothetical protein